MVRKCFLIHSLQFLMAPFRSAFNSPALGKQPGAYNFRVPFPIYCIAYESLYLNSVSCIVRPCPFWCCLYHSTPPISWHPSNNVPPCSCNATFFWCHFIPCCIVLVFYCYGADFYIVCTMPPWSCAVTFLMRMHCPLFVLQTEPPFNCFIVLWLPFLI